MNDIDTIDRKIIYQLSMNSRQSNNQLAKRIRVKNNIVTYRLKRLEENKILTRYYTVTNTYNTFGLSSLRFHYSFDLLTSSIEEKIKEYVVSAKNVSFASRTFGEFDLSFIYHYKNILDLYSFIEEFKKEFGQFIKKESISHYICEYYRPPVYLNNDGPSNIWILTGSQNIPDMTPEEIQILCLLAEDAKMPLWRLSQHVGLTSETISKKIRYLMKNGIITGFRTLIDIKQLGLDSYKLNISLKDHSKKQQIIRYIESNPYLVYIDVTIGEYDLEFEFHLPSLHDLAEIIADLNKHYPESIHQYSYILAEKNLKFTYFPKDCLL